MPKAQFQSVTPLVPAGPHLADDLRFYTEELGFEIAWQGGNMAGVRRGNIAFNLVESDNRNWFENASASLGVDDLDALHEEYSASCTSTRVGRLEMKGWGRREFHMILPSGVCLQFFQTPKEG